MIRLVLFMILIVSATASAFAQSKMFHGYPCTQDCSGHKAGFEWSQRKGIQEKEECGGHSNSFIEGCYAWVDYLQSQQLDQVRDDSQDFPNFPPKSE